MKWSQIPVFLVAASSTAAAKVSSATSPPAGTDCAGIKAVSPQCQTQEAAARRDVFFLGGRYVAGDRMTDQVYVEKLTPASGVSQPYPLVFVSSGIPSGTVWLNTPDNRQGWASYFLDRGYQVYVLDVAAMGRSSQSDVDRYPFMAGGTVAEHERGFTAPEKVVPATYPQARGHDQWPGSGTRGDAVFDAFYAATLPWTTNLGSVELAMRAGGCALLELVGPSFVVAHSGGASYATVMADECPHLVRATVNLEPANLPFASVAAHFPRGPRGPRGPSGPSRAWGLARTPLAYDPPVQDVETDLVPVEVGTDSPERRSCFLQSADTVRTLTNVAKVPYLMFTAPASVHATMDHCFLPFLEQAGVKNVTWVRFEDKGLEGNGHFFFLEKNSMQLAELVEAEMLKLSSGPAEL